MSAKTGVIGFQLSACGGAGNVNGVVMTSPERSNALQASHEGRCAGVNERNVRRLEDRRSSGAQGRGREVGIGQCLEVQISRRCSM